MDEEIEVEEVKEHVTASGNLIDSKTSHLDDQLNERLEAAFLNEKSQVLEHEIAKIASDHDPIDLAYAVSRLPPSARPVVYNNLPNVESKVSFLINTGGITRTVILRQIALKDLIDQITLMPTDEAVDVVDDLSEKKRRILFDNLDFEKARRIQELMKHHRDSAGRLMTNEFFAFNMQTTIGEVVDHIRNNPEIELMRRIFVVDDDNEMVGFVPFRNLIINSHTIAIRQVMQSVNHQVSPEATRDEVVDLVERYKIPALPVVDKENHLLGVIAYEDIVEVMEDIADETIATIAGTAEDFSEHESIVRRFFWRAPWLLVTLCAGLTTATAMSHFGPRPWFLFVPFFVPLINGFSGNVGIQCSTHMVRNMSTGEISVGSKREAVRHEVMIGLMTGFIFGLFCGVIVYLLNVLGVHQIGTNPIATATIVSCGVLSACVTASCLGAFSPLIFSRFKIDPAVASGPIVTAFNDVLSTLMYFFVAYSVSTFLFH